MEEAMQEANDDETNKVEVDVWSVVRKIVEERRREREGES